MAVSKKKIALYSIAGVLLTLVAFVGVVYLQISDFEKIKTMAVDRLEEITGRDVSIGSAEVSFVKGISVNLKEVSIGGSHAGRPKFNAKNLRMVIKFLPLLDQQIEVKKIVVEGVFIQLIRNAKGEFNLAKARQLTSQPKKEGLFKVLKGSLINRLEIKGGEVRFLDYKNPTENGPASLKIQNVHFLIRKKFLQIPFEFLVQGQIPNSNRPSEFKLTGTLNNPTMTLDLSGISVDGEVHVERLPLAHFHPYLKKVIPAISEEGRISLESDFSGTLAGDFESTGKIKFVSEKDLQQPAFRDPSVPHRGILDYQVALDEDNLEIKEIRMQADAFRFSATGGITEFLSPDPGIAFDIRTGAFQVNKSRSYLPLKILPVEYHDLVHQRFKNGSFKIDYLKFKGTLTQLKNLALKENHQRLSGQVQMQHMDWLAPLPLLKNVTASLKVESGDSVLNIEKARFLDHPIANVKGKIKDLIYQPVADLSLDNKVEMGKFHLTLLKGLDGHSFKEFVRIYRDMQGPGRVSIHLKGPLTDPEKLSLSGSIIMQGVSLYQEGIGPRINNLHGTIHYNLNPPESKADAQTETPIIQFDNFNGNFGESRFSKIEGKVILQNEIPNKKISGIYNLHVADLPMVITDLELEYPFDVLHQNTDYVEGGVEVHYFSDENPLDAASLNEWGTIKLQDLTVEYKEEGILPITNLSGDISFGEGPLDLAGIKGWYGSSPFTLDGDLVPYTPKGPEFDLVMKSAKLQPEDLKDIPFLQSLKFTGSVDAEVKLKGRLDTLTFAHSMDLSQASYRYKDVFIKHASLFNKVQMNGHFDSKEGLVVEDLVYELGGNTVTGRTVVKDLQSPDFFVRLQSKNFKTHLLATSLTLLEGNREGLADFEVHGQGNFHRLQDSKFEGLLDLKDVVFLPEGHAHAVTVNAAIKFSDDTFEVNDGSLASDRSQVAFSGMYETGSRPQMELNVTGKRLLIEELLPTGETEGPDLGTFLNESPLFARGTCNVTFDLEELDYKLLTLKEVSGDVSVEKKKFKISKLDFGKENKIRGRGIFEMESSDAGRFKGLIQANDIPAEDLFALFGDTFEDGMTGQLKTLDIRIKGKGKGWKEIGKSLVSKTAFDFQSGQIDHGKLKRGALKLFGLKDQADESAESVKDDFSPYEQIAGSFMLSGGIAETENFIYEDDRRRSSLVGKFDLKQREMDTVLGVAPMAALDKFLTKIPVVGKIITGGDEESLVKSYYTVKGKFDDPKISIIPLTSLTKKVVGIFQGILQTPKFILTLPGEETN